MQLWKNTGWWAGVLLILFIVTGIGLRYWLFKTIRGKPLSRARALRLARKLPDMVDKLLQQFVSPEGRVNYRAMRQNPELLNRILGVMYWVSPETLPRLFSSQTLKLSYWINAYNVSVLRNVLAFPRWNNLSSRWRQFRFFAAHSFVYGRKTWSLYNLEMKLIRPRFREPRIHFAINCASLGCPRLPLTAFRGEKLDAQLDKETRKFLHENRNVSFLKEKRIVKLSSILKWFESDFLNGAVWRGQKPGKPTILKYLNLYRAPERKIPVKGVQVQYLPYDWRLNSQHPRIVHSFQKVKGK